MSVGHDPRAAISRRRLPGASRRTPHTRWKVRRWNADRDHQDPLALRQLDRGRFSLGGILIPPRANAAPLANAELFRVPSMRAVRQTIDAEFDRYVDRHKADLPKETIGVGDSFGFQLLDRAQLHSRRYALRAVRHRQPDGPRLSRRSRLRRGPADLRLTKTSTFDEDAQRLPMTLNVILRAKEAPAADAEVTCAEIARGWLASGDEFVTGVELAAKLLKDGPLKFIWPKNIDRIEINLQIAHAPESAVRDFRTGLPAQGVPLQRAGARV